MTIDTHLAFGGTQHAFEPFSRSKARPRQQTSSLENGVCIENPPQA